MAASNSVPWQQQQNLLSNSLPVTVGLGQILDDVIRYFLVYDMGQECEAVHKTVSVQPLSRADVR